MLYFRTGFKKGTCGRPGGQAGIPLKGPVAEWLGRALQKLLQRFESARDLEDVRSMNGRLFFRGKGLCLRQAELNANDAKHVYIIRCGLLSLLI